MATCLAFYPMVMGLRKDGEIRFISDTMQTRVPNLRVGDNFIDSFVIVGPEQRSIATIPLTEQHLKTLYLIHAKDKSYAFRGSFILGQHEDQEAYFFLGSPWSAWLYDNHEAPSLNVNEFPIVDGQFEMQFYIASQKMMLQDMEDLVASLHHSKIAAESSARAKTHFVRHISHELRTPLHGLMTALDLALPESNVHKRDEFLETARNCSSILMDLINEVLDYSRIEDDIHISHSKVFQIRKLFTEIEHALSARIQGKNIQLLFGVSSEVPQYIKADRNSLRKILMNLVGNAIKYSGSDTVWIRAALKPVDATSFDLQIEVEDFGIGIDKAFHDLVFNPFWVANESNSSEPSTGLGLTITKLLVEKMGGAIEFSSAKNAGTKFSFRVAAAYVEAGITEPTKDAPSPLAKYLGRVLLVEDNLINLKLTKYTLERMGLIVTEAESGARATHIAQQSEFDLILMDIGLPDMSGIQASQKIRSNSQNSGTPIVAFTANVSADDVQSYKNAGLNDALSKPVINAELHRILKLYLRTSASKIHNSRQDSDTLNGNYDSPILDESLMFALMKDVGLENWRLICDLFVKETKKRHHILHGYLTEENAKLVEHEAHKMASSVLSFGLIALGQLLRNIEHEASKGKLPSTRSRSNLSDLFKTSLLLFEQSKGKNNPSNTAAKNT